MKEKCQEEQVKQLTTEELNAGNKGNFKNSNQYEWFQENTTTIK